MPATAAVRPRLGRLGRESLVERAEHVDDAATLHSAASKIVLNASSLPTVAAPHELGQCRFEYLCLLIEQFDLPMKLHTEIRGLAPVSIPRRHDVTVVGAPVHRNRVERAFAP